MEKYSIYKLQKNDFDKLIPLMKDCFGMDVDINYFKWKYQDNPAGFVEGYYALDNDNNEIVAYYGGIPQVFYYNQKKFNLIQPCDAMTHSQHRRLGLFERLVAHCDNELKKKNKLFLIGFAGSKSTPGFIKFGWKVLFDVRNYFVLPFYIKLFYRLNKSEYSFQFKSSLDDVKHLFLKSQEMIKDSLLIEKNFENYQWRLKNPLHHYSVSAIKPVFSEHYTSYIIHYIENKKIVIFDFYFSNKNEATSLLKNIYIKISVDNKVKGVISFCQYNSYWSNQLSQLNFLSNPFSKGPLSEKMYFVINTSVKSEVDVFSNKSWNLNSFEHDCL